MTFTISRTLRDELLSQPESGMGYQIAIVNERSYVAFNADLAVPVHYIPFRLSLISSDKGLGFKIEPEIRAADNETDYLGLTPFFSTPDDRSAQDYRPPHSFAFTAKTSNDLAELARQVLANPDPDTHRDKFEPLDGTLTKVVTHGSYLSKPLPGELFVRYSAFLNDRRIGPGGSVLPGTYATTIHDDRLVPSSLSAVARYALPNPTPAIHRFVISPSPQTRIHCGTVTPQFGQAGGGVEVRFGDELPEETASGPHPIPER